jgi:hypothetical protein
MATAALADVVHTSDGQRQDATYLSDLTPADSVHVPFFDDESPWQRDKTALGRALSLDGNRYEKGLGLHARARLVFDLEGRYARLRVIVGVDDDLRGGRRIAARSAGRARSSSPVTLLAVTRLHLPLPHPCLLGQFGQERGMWRSSTQSPSSAYTTAGRSACHQR